MAQHGAQVHVAAPIQADRQRQHGHHQQGKENGEREAVVHQGILNTKSSCGCLKSRKSASPHPDPFMIRYYW